jgi:superfamily II DNA or RNA helicase
MSKSGYIDLKVNGRLFPTWLLMNFKKYKLPEIIREKGKDPCSIKTKAELRAYQEFLATYLSYKSPFKDIFIYHGLGSGKTVSAINIYNILFNYTPDWNVFILIKASLRDDPWMKDLKIWLSNDERNLRFENIKFIHYDSPFADKNFIETIQKVDSSKQSIYIFDEAHNFIKNVYNNISTKKGKRAQVIYDYIQQEKKENDNTRIILLSATPAVNNPYELALTFNLLRPGSFPESERTFNQMYISSSNFHSLNEEYKNMFQRRIMGLVSYYIGATPDLYAQKTTQYKNLIMPKYYQGVYDHFEDIEEEKERMRRKFSRGKVGNDQGTYSAYTRQASNFVFPHINDKINGETRPRPGNFMMSEKEFDKLNEGKSKNLDDLVSKNKEALNDYVKATQNYLKAFTKYCDDIDTKDKSKKHTILNDVENYIKKYKGKFEEFHKNEKKSLLYDALYICSPKMVHIGFRSIKSKGPVLVYSNYVSMEGLEILKIYLSYMGFLNYSKDTELNLKKLDKKYRNDYYRYIEYHGGIKDRKVRTQNKNIFNMSENVRGSIIKIIMISPAGAEGINLKNVRQVHIMEPFWNEVRIEQIIGRAIRQCSHKDLPMDERKVDVYRYKMIRENEKETTDEKMEDISRKKNNLIQSFLEAVREVAVDCGLFRNHNMLGTEYKCFQFNEDSLFDKYVGPGYKKDQYYDKKIDNGANALNSEWKKIKVRKVKIVNKIEDKYSKEQNAWYYEDTGIVYDYDLHFPLGKVELDDKSLPMKLNNDTYIIGETINIPFIEN